METIIYCIIALFIAAFLVVGFYQTLTTSSKKQPCFVLLTDFGYDFAVGSMKAVILNKIPNAHIIDLDHSIEKFNVASASFVLEKSYHYFPKGSIFLCIVDPHVGTQCERLCIKTPSYTFIGPNNGIFDAILAQEPQKTIYAIDDSYLVSGANTFHGRDLFAPAAVDFYKGDLKLFKPFDNNKLVNQKPNEDQVIALYIDSFGNIKTNKKIDQGNLKDFFVIDRDNKKIHIPVVKTFGDVGEGNLLCYPGSNGTLEIAVNLGSAAKILDIKVGDSIMLS
jgi:S-adenosylmethionine hydrolase